MPLSVGDQLGHYEVLSLLGQGGMGEVYRARDTTLQRNVALKVLPATFLRDPERMARFQREAQVLASLDHPNIGHIHGVVDSEDSRGLVLALIEGPTLAERIEAGPLLQDETIAIAKQIIEALEYAHDRGVVHRDLKPANVKITPDGVVKVLDFGLAKVLEDEPPASSLLNSPTLTMGHTRAGVILGTAAYMSPEQAVGRPVDRRSDIFSFGAVLYEMLTAKRAFNGTTTPDVFEAVVKNDPDWSALPGDTPRYLRTLLERTLAKDRKQRLQAIGEARIALDSSSARDSGSFSLPGESASSGGPRSILRPTVWMALTATALLIATTASWMAWRVTRPVEHPLMRLSVDLGPDALVGSHITVAISPDGKRIAFPVRGPDSKPMLATRLLDQEKATLLAGTEESGDAFFSPDGQWIGFFTATNLQKISVQGGAPVVLGDASASNARGADWGDDGTIVAELVNTKGLVRLSDSGGGSPEQLTQLQAGEATHRWPQMLPGSQAVIFTSNNNISAFDDASIEVLNLKTNQRKTLWRGGYFGRYIPATGSRGYLVFIHLGTLFGASFDLDRLEFKGTPVPLLNDIAGDPTTAAGQLDFSQTGTLVYRSGKATARTYPMVWLDSSGKTQPLLAKAGSYYTPRLSPDGQRLAISLESGKDQDVWVYDPRRDTMSRLTYTTQGGLYPVWSPDGKHIAFQSTSDNLISIKWIRSDGGGEPQLLLESKTEVRPDSFSPDGRRLAFTEHDPGTGFDLWSVTLDLSDSEHPKPGKPELFLRTPSNERDGVFSPDGRWIAYTSDESGTRELYVRPFPGPGGKWQISTGGAAYPKWPTSGHTLFYESVGQDRIMAADYVSTGDSFSASKPRVWASLPMLDTSGNVNLDVTPDGKRFAVFPALDAMEATKGSVHVTFLLNFIDELRRKVPPSK